jgi:hypothetical protein
VVTLPEPVCRGGYTRDQIRQITGPREQEFESWMRGQTIMLCQGEGKCDGVIHGVIVFPWDVQNFLNGGPILD